MPWYAGPIGLAMVVALALFAQFALALALRVLLTFLAVIAYPFRRR